MKMNTIIGILIFFMLSSCNILNSGEQPDIPGKIVFSAKDGKGTSQIYTMNADGSDVDQLTHLENEGAFEPSWSPDGGQIVFTTSLRSSSGGFSLYLMDAHGSDMQPLHEREGSHIPTAGSNPRWSPDGTRITWHQCINCELGGGNYEIFIYEFATDSVIQVTDHPASDTNPSWSPDGSQIVFASNRDYPETAESDLYIIDLNGDNLTRLTETGNASRPVWSPQDHLITYEWGRGGNNVYLYEMPSGKITRIDTGMPFSGYPMWSRNGTTLLVIGREFEAEQPEVRLLDMEMEPPQILQKTSLKGRAIGRDYNWYNKE